MELFETDGGGEASPRRDDEQHGPVSGGRGVLAEPTKPVSPHVGGIFSQNSGGLPADPQPPLGYSLFFDK